MTAEAASARPMAYGWGDWTAETLQSCSCGHPRGDHFRHRDQCLHSTDEEVWACNCDGFFPEKKVVTG